MIKSYQWSDLSAKTPEEFRHQLVWMQNVNSDQFHTLTDWLDEQDFIVHMWSHRPLDVYYEDMCDFLITKLTFPDIMFGMREQDQPA